MATNNEHSFDFDFFVIGAGSGGVRAARMAGSFGAKVAVAEERFMGGTCVNVGCVPKKLFVYGAHYKNDFADAAGFGWKLPGEPRFDWSTLLNNKNAEIERLNGIYRRLLESNKVKIYDARATIVDPHTVEIAGTGERVTAQHILVATGSTASRPEFPGAEHVITSLEAFYLKELPKRALVLGGGYIACEFAGIFEGLGVHTELVYRGTQILRGFDDDLRAHVGTEMRKRGIVIRTETDIAKIEPVGDAQSPDELRVHFQDGSSLTSDLVFAAIGRAPNTQGLGLENAGVSLNPDGSVPVDEYFKSQVDSIYAVGDVINRFQLTPVALAEGMALARNLFLPDTPNYTVDYENIATAVFCEPNIGTVGLTESEARERFGEKSIQIFRSEFRPMKNTLSGNEGRSLMKLIVNADDDRVLGVHMAGPDAGEIIQGMAVALKAGATKAVFDATIGIHPTAAEEFVTMRTPVA